MPILATGRSPEPVSMLRQRAFTLLELVVVLALIGVILSFARLSLGDGGAAARLEQDARTLAAALRLAHDEAVLDGREFGLRLAADGYDFMQLSGKTWRPLTGRQPLRARRLERRPAADAARRRLPGGAGRQPGRRRPAAGVLCCPAARRRRFASPSRAASSAPGRCVRRPTGRLP